MLVTILIPKANIGGFPKDARDPEGGACMDGWTAGWMCPLRITGRTKENMIPLSSTSRESSFLCVCVCERIGRGRGEGERNKRRDH